VLDTLLCPFILGELLGFESGDTRSSAFAFAGSGLRFFDTDIGSVMTWADLFFILAFESVFIFADGAAAATGEDIANN
jgi:hypothetical protein